MKTDPPDRLPLLAAALDSFIAVAEAKLGSREAVLQALNNLSRQRLQSALTGGPPLRAERLLRLALVAEIDPIELLRAGGRHELADSWEQLHQPHGKQLTTSQRALLRDFEQLPGGHQGLVRQFVRGLLTGKPDTHITQRRRRGCRAREPRADASEIA